MLDILVLLAVAVAVILCSPSLLAHGAWRIRHPRTAVLAWLGALALGGAALVVSVVFALVQVMTATRHSGWFSSAVVVLFCWTSLASVGGLCALVAVRAEPITAAQRRAATSVLFLTATSTYRRARVGGIDVAFVESDVPVALATPNGSRQIVISSGLEDELSPAELRAVVEHERAHILHRHDRILQVAQLNAACFPILRGARQFEAIVHLLVELIADDRAARICGAGVTADAIGRVGVLLGDEAMSVRADRIRRAHPCSAPRGTAAGALLARRRP